MKSLLGPGKGRDLSPSQWESGLPEFALQAPTSWAVFTAQRRQVWKVLQWVTEHMLTRFLKSGLETANASSEHIFKKQVGNVISGDSHAACY